MHLLPGGAHGVRAVTHLDVDRAAVERALAVMRDVLVGRPADVGAETTVPQEA